MQSVAALVFIAVLIVLLLILTVMVHMRNRKLKSTLEEQIAERRLLDKICADFTAVYYVELNTGFFEILHMNDGTNAKKMNLKQCDNFNYAADQYAVQYLYEKERKEFKDWISTRYLKEQLSRRERITYHYRSKPNPNQHEFFEAQAIKIYQDEKHFFALVGFRHIDDIMEKETTIQNQLRQALDETRLSNEIISAIAKSYCSIYRMGRVLRHPVLHQLQPPLGEGLQLHGGGEPQHTGDLTGRCRLRIDGHGQPQLTAHKPQLAAVFRAADTGDGVLHTHFLRHKAREDINLVAGGSGDQQIGLLHIRLLLHIVAGAVAAYAHHIIDVDDVLNQMWILVDHCDPVLHGQMARQGHAHLARAHNDDLHAVLHPFFRRDRFRWGSSGAILVQDFWSNPDSIRS